jgi:O-succinylbenzoate synthase
LSGNCDDPWADNAAGAAAIIVSASRRVKSIDIRPEPTGNVRSRQSTLKEPLAFRLLSVVSRDIESLRIARLDTSFTCEDVNDGVIGAPL